MQRIYCSQILQRPFQLKIGRQTINVRALQFPIAIQRWKGKEVCEVKIDPTKVEEAFLAQKNKFDPIPVHEDLILHFKFEEEQGRSGNYTLVFDEEATLPTYNLRNDVLNRAGFKAVEITKDIPDEVINEARITMLLAGSGHSERLIRLQNQPEFNFIIDKLDLAYPFLNYIKDEFIRKFTETALLLAFNQFYIGPSSTSGKYHPADEVALTGLLHHCKRVAKLVSEIGKRLGLDQHAQDEMISAALLHDIAKSVEINEQEEFEWGYHSVEDHSVIGAIWLEKILEEYFPRLTSKDREKAGRIIKSVKYHQNIWVDNYDTALTSENSLSDWLVASSDIIAGLSNARVHYSGEPEQSPEEVLNDLLNYRPEGPSQYIRKKDSPKLKRTIFLAETLFKHFEIKEKDDRDKIIQAIRRGEAFPAEELSKDKSKLIVTLAKIVPELKDIDIWLPEDIAREAKKIKKTPLKWHSRKDPQKTGKVAKELPELLLENYSGEYLGALKLEFLNKINRRVQEKNQVFEDEVFDDLLLELMLEFGTLDIDQIYQRMFEVCNTKGRKEIRELLQKSLSAEETIQGIRKIVKRSGYSGTAIGKVEKKLREKLNQALPASNLQFKKFDRNIIAMLREEFGNELAEKIIAEIVDLEPRRVLRRIENRIAAKNSEKIVLPGKIRDVLRHELQYCQPQPFNRMNRDIINWLMQRYQTTDGNLIYGKIYDALSPKKRKAVAKILRSSEAEARKLEAKQRGPLPKKQRKKLLDSATAKLSKILLEPKKEKDLFWEPKVTISEFIYLSQFLVNYGLEGMKNIKEYLAFARQKENLKEYDYFNYRKRLKVPGIAKGVEIAIEKIDKIDQGEKIMIYGDYDVDGIMGTTILVKSLREIAVQKLRRKGKYSERKIKKLVEQNIRFYIPDRERGFGLNNRSLQEIIDAGFRTVITTDNGGNNHKEIEFAKNYNPDVKIIVTDHHTLSKDLPQADAIIHTKLLSHDHPAHFLAGAGVAYKFARALYDAAGLDIGKKYLEYVAMATITDVVPVPKGSENRAFLYFGFQKFNELFKILHELEKEKEELEVNEMGDSAGSPSEPRERGKSLYDEEEFKKSGLDIGLYLLAKNLRIYSLDRVRIAFGLGPILNAIGRLAEASPAVNLLLTQDPMEAFQIIEKLAKNNEMRKELQAKITEEALTQLEKMIKEGTFEPEKDYSTVLINEGWHPGIIGPVAATIAELMRILVAMGNLLKGSTRSIPGLHIMKIFRKAVELYKQDGHRGSFFERFGGHAGAAGYTIKEDKLEEFKVYLKRAAQETAATDPYFLAMYGKGKPEKFVRIDAYLPARMISASLYKLINLFGPFGRESYERANEVAQPIWGTKGLRVMGWRVIGGQKDHLEITFEDQTGRQIPGLYFRENKVETKALFYREDPNKEEVYVDIAYTLDVDYKGNPKLIIKDLKEAPKNKAYSKPEILP